MKARYTAYPDPLSPYNAALWHVAADGGEEGGTIDDGFVVGKWDYMRPLHRVGRPWSRCQFKTELRIACDSLPPWKWMFTTPPWICCPATMLCPLIPSN